MIGRHWAGELGNNANRYHGTVSIRSALALNEVYEGQDANAFEFVLSSFGFGVRDGMRDSDLPNGLYDLRNFGEKHDISIRSSSLDMRNLTASSVGIAGNRGPDIIETSPSGCDGWTTDDLEQADTASVPNNEVSLWLGGAGLVLGVLAGIPTLGTGTAAYLTGWSALFGVGSLVSSLGTRYDAEEQTDREWRYTYENSGLMGPHDLSTFMHNLIFRVPVPKGEHAYLNVDSHIENSGGHPTTQEASHEFVGNHGDDASWNVMIPAYDDAPDARERPPIISGTERTYGDGVGDNLGDCGNGGGISPPDDPPTEDPDPPDDDPIIPGFPGDEEEDDSGDDGGSDPPGNCRFYCIRSDDD